MTGKLADKVAIVTGSGRGVGRIIALAMANEGADIVVNDLNVQNCRAVAAEIEALGRNALPVPVDVSITKQTAQLVHATVETFGKIDILVNNAGVVVYKPLWEMTEQDFDIVINSHLKGTFNCTLSVCNLMKQQRSGRIINCTSDAWLGIESLATYSAAKGGIVSFSKSIAIEIAQFGITCNVYCPFGMSKLTPEQLEVLRKALKSRYDAGLISEEEYERMCDPPTQEGIGPLVAYLATDEAAGINGQVFYVSGGEVSLYSHPVKVKTIQAEEMWTVEELIELIPARLL